MTLTFIGIGVLGLAAFLALHLAVWQVIPRERKTAALLAVTACAGYGIAAVLAHVAFGVGLLQHGPVSAPVFMFLAVTYFHFYYGIDRSVSVRTLGVLACSPGGRLTLRDLDLQYPKEEMIRRRLDIMIAHGWLIERDGLFHCTDKARRVARIARIGQRLYGVDAAG